MTPEFLKIEGLSAGYTDEPVVRDFSATFPRGSITTIVGGNGAGKSTLLKSIYGLTTRLAGSVVLDGADISRHTPMQRLAGGIGFVPQGRCNFAGMTVQENLLMGCYTVPRAERAPRVAQTLETFPVLARKYKTSAGSLSGGEQQILETAMVLLTRPRLLLLDEPSLGLSPVMQDQIFEMVRDIRDRLGITSIIVEQNVFVALEVSDEALVMDGGRKLKQAPAREVMDDPEINALYFGRH